MSGESFQEQAKRMEYIGDGVYACIECGMVRLVTSDGESFTNEIYLEGEVYEALVRFVERKRADAAAGIV